MLKSSHQRRLAFKPDPRAQFQVDVAPGENKRSQIEPVTDCEGRSSLRAIDLDQYWFANRRRVPDATRHKTGQQQGAGQPNPHRPS